MKTAFQLIFSILFHRLCCTESIDLSYQQLQSAISQAKQRVEFFRIQSKIPGLSVGVSHRGEEIWTDGFGFADLENGVPCTSRSLHRIGSISKSISMLLLGKLWEENRIDLDKPIYDYLGDKFPIKTFKEREVNITLRQLVSHKGGIRHYYNNTEFLQKEGCNSIFDSLKYFKDDPLIAEPGEEYHYSSFGFVTVGAVLQTVLNESQTFESAMLRILKNDLGMIATYLDQVDVILLNRVKYYKVNEQNQLQIAPFVDASCRWPGGGLLSNVHDLLLLGNVMLYSNSTDKGYLTKATVNRFWDKIVLTRTDDLFNVFYGMGWELLEVKQSNCLNCDKMFSLAVGHSGGSSGAVCYLLIVPEEELIVVLLTNVEPLPEIREVTIDLVGTFIKHIRQNEENIPSLAYSTFNQFYIPLQILTSIVVLFKIISN